MKEQMQNIGRLYKGQRSGMNVNDRCGWIVKRDLMKWMTLEDGQPK